MKASARGTEASVSALVENLTHCLHAKRSGQGWIAKRVAPVLKLGHRTLLFQPEKVLRALEKFEIQQIKGQKCDEDKR
jgi:hypothetical protein